jgi:hypothetical protein
MYVHIAPSCSSASITPQKPTAPRAYSHEEIGSFCTTSPTFGAEYETWEAEWAESEVGEGLEEIWERAVSLYELNVSTTVAHGWKIYLYPGTSLFR